MNQTGHRGVALGAGSVVALGLFYFGLVSRTVLWGCLLLLSVILGTVAAPLPDQLETVLDVDHRQETHTVWFAVGTGVAIGAVPFALARLFNVQIVSQVAGVRGFWRPCSGSGPR